MLRREDLPDGLLPRDGPVRIADRFWWVGHIDARGGKHSYLLEQGDQSVLFHPGSASSIRKTLARTEQIVPFSALRWFVCTHAEPDVVGALPLLDQLIHRTDARVLTHSRVADALRHLDINVGTRQVDIDTPAITLEDRVLRFIETPHMHGAFASFDEGSGTLLWGDLAAALAPGDRFEAVNAGDLEDICAFQARALPHRGVLSVLLDALAPLEARQIAPRAGPLVSGALVPALLQRLTAVQCAIDREELNLPERDDRPADDRLPDLRTVDNRPLGRPTPARPTLPTPEERYARAVRDDLTGLYTRSHMTDTVARWARFQDRDNDQMVSVIVFDVDGMRGINATFGLSAGDQVLVRIAEVIRQQCRDEDLPVRIDGEIFALFLFGDNPDAAPSLASRIAAVVRSKPLATGAGAPMSVTLSAGTTCRSHGEPLEQMLARADAARRAGKAAGGDRVETR